MSAIHPSQSVPEAGLATSRQPRRTNGTNPWARRFTQASQASMAWVVPGLTLLVWEAVVRAGWVAPHLLPAPTTLLQTLQQIAADGSLWRHLGVSSSRVAIGFGIGATLGLAVGALVALSQRAERLLDPSLQGLRAVPSLAWVPLLLLWLGIDNAPKLALIAIGSFFPMYLATVSSLKNVDRKLVEVGQQLGLSRGALLRRIYLPSALPALLTGLRASLGLAWMFLVAAELIGASAGLGYLLTDGRETGRADLVMVSIIALALIGKATDALLVAIERRLLNWRDVADLSVK
ncbi:MAG: ABC transporter permease [Burkholderiales bacterium]|nr:ABC transporter permease [Nitrosomonadaceae bacterium]